MSDLENRGWRGCDSLVKRAFEQRVPDSGSALDATSCTSFWSLSQQPEMWLLLEDKMHLPEGRYGPAKTGFLHAA